jgi:probable F420-dependent oxidoreductase
VRPFRFGLSVGAAGSRAEWVDKARRVEDLGFSTLVIPDHLAPAMPPLAPLLPLVSAAGATKTLRVGTFVLNNDFRHPVLLAREAAALDLLTDGRLELGLGAGHMQSEYDAAGLRFDPGRVRVERLGESVRVIKALLVGSPTTFEGEHYRVRGHVIYPKPLQQPHPPILIGGHGRRLLSIAAREADTVGFVGFRHLRGGTAVDASGFRPSAVDERVALVRAEAGERFGDLELNVLVQRVVRTDDPRREAAAVHARRPEVSPEEVLETPFFLFGTADQMVEALRVRRERWGFSYYVAFEPHLDALAPVVARLAGK